MLVYQTLDMTKGLRVWMNSVLENLRIGRDGLRTTVPYKLLKTGFIDWFFGKISGCVNSTALLVFLAGKGSTMDGMFLNNPSSHC